MLQEMIKAFLLIFIAEMGDKTQILAMAFATRYPVRKVLAGIFVGVLLNHGIAVFLGNYLSQMIPLEIVQIVAGCAFIGFALWTLKYEEDDEEEESQRFKLGPVMTVAAAFFIGELGDKTQLSAITLAAGASYPVAILAGTVAGMMVTGGLGIFVGKKLGDKIPELGIKISAATVFMIFGMTKLYSNIPEQYLNPFSTLLVVLILGIVMALMIKNLFQKKRAGVESGFSKQSRKLFDYYNKVESNIESICCGVENCGQCQGKNCVVGHTRELLKNAKDQEAKETVEEFIADKMDKQFNREEAIKSLSLTLALIKDDPDNEVFNDVHRIRRNLEHIVFGKCVSQMDSWEEYAITISEMDQAAAESILNSK